MSRPVHVDEWTTIIPRLFGQQTSSGDFDLERAFVSQVKEQRFNGNLFEPVRHQWPAGPVGRGRRCR